MSMAAAIISASAADLVFAQMSQLSWKCSRSRPRCCRSYRNSWGMENHRIGLRSPRPRAPTMRASVGVISGRSATSRPPLSVKL